MGLWMPKTGSDADSVFFRQTTFNQEVRIAHAGDAVVCAVTLKELIAGGRDRPWWCSRGTQAR